MKPLQRDHERMDMQRRHFALGLTAAAWLAPAARAAVEPIEGRNFTQQSTPQPVAVAGKIEVIEFFGYWCPHCRSLEPALEEWARKLPTDVNFRRVPVAWQAAQEPYQRLYFALESVAAAPLIHQKVFQAVQLQGMRLEVPAALAAFASANGIDAKKLADAMSGFAVASKARVATQVAQAYRIDGVPALAIHGRYLTAPDKAGSNEAALQVAAALIRKAKAGR
jgi:thiol:disulfide interchange protein DsbA